MKNQKRINRIGWFASIMAILMFTSYIDQIRLNMAGKTGSILLPLATTVNCISWVCYALLKEKRDWPVFLCNFLGAIVGVITTISAIIYSGSVA